MKQFAETLVIHIPEEQEKIYSANGIDFRYVDFTTNSTTSYSFGDIKNGKQTHYELAQKSFDLAFFIKISGDITKHIIFCNYGVNVMQTVEYFAIHTKKIYKFAKKCGRLNDSYFFILPINRVGESIEFSTDFVDLTDIMFNNATSLTNSNS